MSDIDITERLKAYQPDDERSAGDIIEICDEAAAEIERVRAEVEEASRYAERLAVSLHAKHYAGVTQWEPLSGDLIGLLTQIDNMAAGLTTGSEAMERAAQIAEQLDPDYWGNGHTARLIQGDIAAAIRKEGGAK